MLLPLGYIGYAYYDELGFLWSILLAIAALAVAKLEKR